MLERLALSNDALKTKGAPSFESSQARNWTCSSLSMTHGPAMRESGAPFPISSPPSGSDVMRTGRFENRSRRKAIGCATVLFVYFAPPALPILERGADEGAE